MTHESYKAWLDEMPIDDVRRKIERLERKLADLQVLERLYEERRGGVGEADAQAPAARCGERRAGDCRGRRRRSRAPPGLRRG